MGSVGAKAQSGQWVSIGGQRTIPQALHRHPKIFFSSLNAMKNCENSPMLRS